MYAFRFLAENCRGEIVAKQEINEKNSLTWDDIQFRFTEFTNAARKRGAVYVKLEIALPDPRLSN